MEGRGRGRGLGFLEGLGGGGGSSPSLGLEDLLSPYLLLLPTEPDQQSEPEACQQQISDQDPEPGDRSVPEAELDGELALVDGGEPAADPESVPTSSVTPLSSGSAAASVRNVGRSPLTSSAVVSSRSSTQVRIAGLDRLFGTDRDDRIRGSRRVEFFVGRRGRDVLTGGDGPDRFGFRWGDSRIGAPDRITDFTFGEDKISLFGRQSRLHGQPLRLSRAADNSTATSLKQLAAEVFADADGRRAGNQGLRRRSAVLVQATNRRIRGTYLLINNNKPDLNLRRDLMVNITAFSGDLPDFGRIDPGALFG